jgi:D-alanyl-D-alanine carboxypeptidase
MAVQIINRRAFLKVAGVCTLFPSVLLGSQAACSRAAWTQTGPENLNNLLESIRVQHGVPALAAAFVRSADLIALGAVGTREINGAERVQLNDRFHIGSCTKSMTATLIALLIEQGRLSWETTIAEIFPDLLGKIRPEYHKLTPLHFLSHRAGLPGQQKGQDAYEQLHEQMWGLKGSLVEQRRAAVEIVLSQPPVAEAGKLFNYSNHGFIIASAMAEQVTGQAWEDLMQEMLFKPLGMETVGFGAPGTASIVDQPRGHTDSCAPVAPGSRSPVADNPPVYGPAGTVHSSMSDWARYISLHLRGARGEEGLLLKPESFERLHKDPFGHNYYALGWVLAERGWAHGPTLSHGGSNGYWFAVVWIAPRRNAAFLAATNTLNCPAKDAGFLAVNATIEAMIRRYLRS